MSTSTRSVDCRLCKHYQGEYKACSAGVLSSITPSSAQNGWCSKYEPVSVVQAVKALGLPEEVLAAPIDLSKCPACKHAKHIGKVCGAEVDVTVNGEGHCEPIRCACHEEARKASAGKCKGFHLLPWDALEELARVYEYGAKKYAPDSWRDVPKAIEEYTNAMFRHWKAVCEGRIWDEEAERLGFKIRHMSMFLWNATAVTALTQKRDGV